MSYREPDPEPPAEIVVAPPRVAVPCRPTEKVHLGTAIAACGVLGAILLLFAVGRAEVAAMVFYGAAVLGTPLVIWSHRTALEFERFDREMDERNERLRRTEEHLRRIEQELRQSGQ